MARLAQRDVWWPRSPLTLPLLRTAYSACTRISYSTSTSPQQSFPVHLVPKGKQRPSGQIICVLGSQLALSAGLPGLPLSPASAEPVPASPIASPAPAPPTTSTVAESSSPQPMLETQVIRIAHANMSFIQLWCSRRPCCQPLSVLRGPSSTAGHTA